MGKFLFKLDKELLELNMIEMDETLIHFFQGLDEAADSFEMINDQGIMRKFKVNWDENTIQGRGINGSVEIVLDHGIVYFIPMIEYDIEILFRSEVEKRTLYYNPITKEFHEKTNHNIHVTV